MFNKEVLLRLRCVSFTCALASIVVAGAAALAPATLLASPETGSGGAGFQLTLGASTSVSTPTQVAETNERVEFSGTIEPASVVYQEQPVSLERHDQSNGWQVIAHGVIEQNYQFEIDFKFLTPGVRTVRAVFGSNKAGDLAVSPPVSITVSQAQTQALTINITAAVIGESQSATIYGVLREPPGVVGGTALTLYGLEFGNPRPAKVWSGSTAAGGFYTAPVTPSQNTRYYAQVGSLKSQPLTVEVSDYVTASPSATIATTCEPIEFTGSVGPDKTGHPVDVQELGRDGVFRTISSADVGSSSQINITWTPRPGRYTIRLRVPGDRKNLAGSTQAWLITVGRVPGICSSAPPLN